jgi:thiamine biosynthesis protein ThiS
MGRTIQITVNGMTEDVPENATLESLIDRFREADPALIVELNGRYVYAREYSTTRVSENDRVEFIHPDFGG